MSSLLIRDVRIVNEETVTAGDLLVRNGRIEAIDGDLAGRPADRVIEGRGRWLLPGLIDDHVHFREPGLEHKADMATESAAAVAGGITSFFEMPNTRPATLSIEALEDKYRRAAGRARANYGFFVGAGHDNLDVLDALDPRSTPGIKVYMTASTGGMPIDDPDLLERIFVAAPVPVVIHCEDTPTIRANEARLRERTGEALAAHHHPAIRTTEACWRASSFAVELAHRHGTNLHVLHLTTAREMTLFDTGPVRDKRVTGEACIHHLLFSDADYAAHGTRIKCNPAIKTDGDRAALLRALRDDRIDLLATDHAPHTAAEKDQPYAEAAAGLPLVQDFLPALLELVHRGELSIEQVVRKTSHNVAERFDVAERGFLREGYHADLVLADPEASTTIDDGHVLSKCGWSPFSGCTFRGRVDATVVSGRLVWHEGELTGAIPGERLMFNR